MPVRSVLLIEDEPFSAELSGTFLAGLNCEVVHESDGKSALQTARQRKFDLILIDLYMPRMDGAAVMRALRELPGHASVPSVLLTADEFAPLERDDLDAFTDVLIKPVAREHYVALLQRLDRAAVKDEAVKRDGGEQPAPASTARDRDPGRA